MGQSATGVWLRRRRPAAWRTNPQTTGQHPGGRARGWIGSWWVWIAALEPHLGRHRHAHRRLTEFRRRSLATSWCGKPAAFAADPATARPNHIARRGRTTLGAARCPAEQRSLHGSTAPDHLSVHRYGVLHQRVRGHEPTAADGLCRGMEYASPRSPNGTEW